MQVFWSAILSFFRSLFGGTSRPLAVPKAESTEGASAEVIKLVTPGIVQAEQPELHVEDSFLLDEPRALGDLVCSVLAEPHAPHSLAHDRAYFSAAEEFTRRGMASLVIPMPQFVHEWQNGVMRTVEYRQVGGNSGMVIPGCPLDDFTRLVEAMVKSAAHRPPSVSAILRGKRHSYRIEIGRGTIRAIYRDID